MKIKLIFDKKLKQVERYLSKGTLSYYKKCFKQLNQMCLDLSFESTKDFDEDSFDQMVDWYYINTEKKNSKIQDTLAAFKTALTYSGITQLPFQWIKLRNDRTHFKMLNSDELEQLLKYLKRLDLNQSNNLMWVTTILLALDTGARKNELLYIKSKNIDFSTGTIYLETTKNTEDRIVQIGSLSSVYVKKLYNKKNKYLLHNLYTDRRITKSSIEKFIARMNNQLQLDSGNVSLHRLRKTFATKLYIAGCPLPTIQKLMGHKDIRTTMIYIEVDMLTIHQHYNKFYPY